MLKAKHAKRLDSFHNQCIRSTLGVTKYQQWKEKLSSRHLAATFSLLKSLLDTILEQRLRWLGHLGRMEGNRLPKRVLFGELEKKRPFHGTKRRWRDVVKAYKEAIGVGKGWYESCQDTV